MLPIRVIKRMGNVSLAIEPIPDEPNSTLVCRHYPNGKMFFKYKTVENEMDGLCSVWYPDGQLCEQAEFSKGLEHGIKRTWYTNGTMQTEGNYVKGKKCGIHEFWYENGQIKKRATYHNGSLNGPLKTWSGNGQVIREAECIRNRTHGIAKRWYINGNPKSVETFDQGRLNGVSIYYDNKGVKKRALYHIRGVKIPRWGYRAIMNRTLSADHVIKTSNSEVRRVFLEELGYAQFLSQMLHEVIDRDKESELVRLNWRDDEETLCLVKVKCPSTGAFYALRVPPTMTSVRQAVAWTFGINEKRYYPEVET